MIKEKKPLVTIVTITFNLIKSQREETFRQCVESVHAQTYDNIEHIIIDGASQDGTLDLIKEYVDKGWITYISEQDSGIYDAMNKGIRMAKGKYIAFLNSDDYYHNKEGVSASVEALEETGADYSFAPATILGVDGKKMKQHPHMQPSLNAAFLEMPFCHQTMFTKVDSMKEMGMFDTYYSSAGDYDFIVRLILKKYFGIKIKTNFATYRLGGLSGNEKSIQTAIRETAEIFQKNYQPFYDIDFFTCSEIQRTHVLPKDLAKKISEITSMKIKIKQHGFLKLSPLTWLNRIVFVFLSPDKFIKKYVNLIMHGKMRQPLRKIYYIIKFKK